MSYSKMSGEDGAGAWSDDAGCNSTDGNESETGEGGQCYRKHGWKSVHLWRDISVEEEYLLAEKVMMDDVIVAGGIEFKEWSRPCDKKIGP